MSELHQDAIYRELFRAKKTLYNDTHDITVHGIPVELYVQDSAEPVVSLGEYSIIHDKWIKVPVRRAAKLDQNAAKAKFDQLKDLIAVALKTKHSKKITKALALIKRYRQAGLDKGGEFSPENLAFKAVRSQGAIDALYTMRDKLHSAELTIEEGYAGAKMKFLKPGELRGSFTPAKLMALGFKKSQNGSWFILQSKWDELRKTGQLYETDVVTERLRKEFEDYDPNGKPPGPEFKPTMPAGTVKVDVSDVYDWYKLGQNISNLDSIDPNLLGKGPPSTIMAFGSEPEEHKYITKLKNIGLKTTDIDPLDRSQPKGMPRQSTDPTYNVDSYADDLDETENDIKKPTTSLNFRTWLSSGVPRHSFSVVRNGKEIARGEVAKDNEWDDDRGASVQEIVVDEPYRRKGIATKIYDAIERKFNYKLRPSDDVKPDGQEFWNDRSNLDEALDSTPYPYEEISSTHHNYIASRSQYIFTTEDNLPYIATIFKYPGNRIRIEFKSTKQTRDFLGFEVTGTGDARKVFATVIDIVKKYVDEHHPVEISFSAKEPSRIRLYDAFLKRLDRELPDYEGKSGPGYEPDNTYYHLTLKNSQLDEAIDRDSAIKQILKLQNTQGRSPSEIEASKTLIAKMMKRYNIHSKELRPVERNPYQNRINQARAERDVAGDMLKAEWDRFKGGIKDKVSTVFKEDFEWQDDPMNWAGTDKDPTPYQGLLRKRVKMSLPGVYPENHKYFIQVFYKNSPTTAVVVYTRNSSDVGRMYREIDFDARGEVPETFWWGDMTLTAEEAFNLHQLQKRNWNGKIAWKSADKQKTKWEPLDEANYDTMSIEDAQKLWIRHGNASRDADSRNDQVAARVHAKLANDIADKVLNSWDGDTIRSKTILARSAHLFDKYPTPTTTIWEPLDEALDSKPYPYEIEEDSIAWQISTFTTSDRNRYKVFLSKRSNKEVNVEFAYQGDDDIDLDIENGLGIKNTGDARRVFATVIEIVKRYANKYKPNMITFSSDPEEPSRMRLYGALVKRADRLLPDYRDISGEISSWDDYILARKGYQVNEASGYIPSKKEANDPRFSTALTVDVKPDSIQKNAKAFGSKTSRAGIPPQARADGKIAESLMQEWKQFLNEDTTDNIFYHVTPAKNVKWIMEEGLTPSTGSASSSYGETEERVYLFPTMDDVQDAVSNWLGDQYEDDIMALLQVDASGINLKSDVEWEYYTNQMIPPNKIKILSMDI